MKLHAKEVAHILAERLGDGPPRPPFTGVWKKFPDDTFVSITTESGQEFRVTVHDVTSK